MDNQTAFVDDLPEPVRQAAEAVGWRELRYGTNQEANRAHFFKIFDSHQQRAEEEESIPPEIRKLIHNVKEINYYEKKG